MYDDETVATMLIEELRQRIANARQHNESAFTKVGARKYGLTVEQVLMKLIQQDIKCAICRNSLEDQGWEIDHDHNTLKPRGLLCNRCNVWLGNNEGRLVGYIKYLADAEREWPL